MEKETALKILRERHDKALFSERTALETLIPELRESESERIKKELLEYLKDFIPHHDLDTVRKLKVWIAWLEKQGESYTKKDVDDAWLKGICDAKRELEKQAEQKQKEYSLEELDLKKIELCKR